jgi:hypothetical protein
MSRFTCLDGAFCPKRREGKTKGKKDAAPTAAMRPSDWRLVIQFAEVAEGFSL